MKDSPALFKSILAAKCPRCRKGNVFKGRVLELKRMGKMYEECSICKLRYEKEPGNIVYGGMYVSYAFSVAIFLTVFFVLYYIFSDPPLLTYIITISFVTLLTYPFNYRYAKVIFLYLVWKV